ncbi:MAG: PEGA domain-containing protein [Vicinamibacterales bacterium]
MTRRSLFAALTLCAALTVTLWPGAAEAQRRDGRRPPQPAVAVPRGPVRVHPVHPAPLPAVRGRVFIGGYFYDPFFGPYPWWTRGAYPYWYAPIFDLQANVRVKVTPKEADDAAVYVDGFYAGVVDDFDGVFQSLPLTPGGHSITLYLDGYRTIRHNLYLARGSTFTLREVLVRLPAGEQSEPPDVAPAVPAPPRGSYQLPVPGRRAPARTADARIAPAAGFGTLDLFVQPDTAEVTVDGGRWTSNEDGHFVLQLPAGSHRVEVRERGFRTFMTEIEVRDGEAIPLNVSLTMMTS